MRRALAAIGLIFLAGAAAITAFRYASGAGGTATKDAASIETTARSSIGKGLSASQSIQESQRTTLTAKDLTLLAALHEAALRAGRGDITGVNSTTRGTARVLEASSVDARSGASVLFEMISAGQLLATSRVSTRSVLVTGTTLGSGSGAALSSAVGDAWTITESTRGGIPGVDYLAALASLVVGHRAARFEEPVLADTTTGVSDQRRFDSFPLVDLMLLHLSASGWPSVGESVVARTARGSSDGASIQDGGQVAATSRGRDETTLEGAARQSFGNSSQASLTDGTALTSGLRRLDVQALTERAFSGLQTGATDRGRVASGAAVSLAFTTADRSTLRSDSSVVAARARFATTHRRIDLAGLITHVTVGSTRTTGAETELRAPARIRLTRSHGEEPSVSTRLAADVRAGGADAMALLDEVNFAYLSEPSSPPGPNRPSPTTTTGTVPPGSDAEDDVTVQPPADLVIVPPTTVPSTTMQAEALSVVWPTLPAKLEIPAHGVTLNVPAGARSTVFQTRVTVESPTSLEVLPEGEVLRVVRIEIFDVLGRPVPDPAPERPLDLVIRLSGGRTDTNGMRLQRFDPEAIDSQGGLRREGAWRDIPLRGLGSDTVVASLDHLSLFALTAVPRSAAGVQDRSTDDPPVTIVRRSGTASRRNDRWIAAAVGIATIAVPATWLIASRLVVPYLRGRRARG